MRPSQFSCEVQLTFIGALGAVVVGESDSETVSFGIENEVVVQ